MRWVLLPLATLLALAACRSQKAPAKEPHQLGEAKGALRFHEGEQTLALAKEGQGVVLVIGDAYPGLSRARQNDPWDLYDSVTEQFLTSFRNQSGEVRIYAINGAEAEELATGSWPDEFAREAPAWGVLSASGSLLYLSTGSKVFVAKRSGQGLAFGAFQELGSGIGIVHDVAPNASTILVSGHREIKWDNPRDIASPRQVGLFAIDENGAVTSDLSAQHEPLSAFMQHPSFLPDGKGIVYEGDDDIDTGDRLFLYRFGETVVELHPAPAEETDFNTPCAMADGAIAFWESGNDGYLLRLYDLEAENTTTAYDTWLPYSGSVRCH